MPHHDGEWRDALVLAIGASPLDLPPLGVAKEFAEAQGAVQHAAHANIMWKPDKAFIHHDWITVDKLKSDLINYRPLVLHISSHAAEYEIMLAEHAPENQHKALKLKDFKTLITLLRNDTIPYPEVIVLNCCYTEAIAKELADIRTATSPEHGPFVIGTKLELGDQSAVNFSKQFYQWLASGKSLGQAFEFAQDDSVDGVYFLSSGGRGSNDIEVAKEYYLPPQNYMIIPIPPSCGWERKQYEKLVKGACRPLRFATFKFIGGGMHETVTVAGMEYKLDQLPSVGKEEISGFGGEADQLLGQKPRPSVPDADNDARYFLNHLRAIKGIVRGPCLFACYLGNVYYEENGSWIKYLKTDSIIWCQNDPVKWGEC
ncbi:hypothetical protein I304_06586 [Cryptococcus deuterogattii CBS 10090]|nr:hypothetical protein I304_06586 [Cryptococcus deuterogattii CBS 10090]